MATTATESHNANSIEQKAEEIALTRYFHFFRLAPLMTKTSDSFPIAPSVFWWSNYAAQFRNRRLPGALVAAEVAGIQIFQPYAASTVEMPVKDANSGKIDQPLPEPPFVSIEQSYHDGK